MKLYESSEDYLETILILSQKQESVHAIDVAKKLNFSKASVSVAMHKLEDNGLLKIAANGDISLTKKGNNIASSVYDRHLTISKALIGLGVSEEQALIDACKMEHDISEETFNALKKRVN